MTKKMIAEALRAKTELDVHNSELAVEIFLESIKGALHEGDNVSLVGLGTFYIKERPARNGINPRTCEHIHIDAKKVAAFRPGKAFKAMVAECQIETGDNEKEVI